jgi:hypothetical protein
MSTVKASLKNAREAIAAKGYDDALKWTQKVLDSDPENYMGYGWSRFPQMVRMKASLDSHPRVSNPYRDIASCFLVSHVRT